jgi:hypothetical protein
MIANRANRPAIKREKELMRLARAEAKLAQRLARKTEAQQVPSDV